MSRILVADDERNIREVLAAFLQDEGHTVQAVKDGQRALEAMRQTRPDLVVMDIMMPELTGIEVLQAMQREPSLDRVPVVLMSSMSQPSLRELGSAAFLPKPFDLDHLLETIGRLLPDA